MLVFKLEGQQYALSLLQVVQIIPMLKITPVPQMDRVVEGFANIHGKIIPIINTRRRLGHPEKPHELHTPIILVQLPQWTLGLIVDEVIDVVFLPADQISLPDAILPKELACVPELIGVASINNQSVLLLNAEQLFQPGQLRALNQVVQGLSKPASLPEQQAAQLPEPALEEVTVNQPKPRRSASKTTRRQSVLAQKVSDQIANLGIDRPPCQGQADGEDQAVADQDPADQNQAGETNGL